MMVFQNISARLKFVQAARDDKAYLLNLRKLTMVEHLEKAGLFLSDSEHASRLGEDYEHCHIIFFSGVKLGMLKFRELEDKIEIIQIQIHPDYQRRNFGKSIIEKILECSKSKNKNVTLAVLKDNPAKRLYMRLGFLISDEDDYEFHMEFKYQND